MPLLSYLVNGLSILKDSESLKAPEIGSNYARFNPFTNKNCVPSHYVIAQSLNGTIEHFIYLSLIVYEILKISNLGKKPNVPFLVASTML